MIYNFKKGDKVKFKTWDEMEKEFGINSAAAACGCVSIEVDGGFPEGMEKECNHEKIYVVKAITSNGTVLFQKEDAFTQGYRITAGMLKLAAPPKTTITISTDNIKFVNASISQGGKCLKRAYARCHPDDEFDLYVGADIALRRLLGVEEKKTVPLKDSPLAPPPETARLKVEYQYDLYHHDGTKVRLKTVGGIGTKFRDALGMACFTGDVVEVFTKEARSLGYYYVLGENADKAFIGSFELDDWRTRLQNHFFIKRANYDAEKKTLAAILGENLKAHDIQRITCICNAV